VIFARLSVNIQTGGLQVGPSSLFLDLVFTDPLGATLSSSSTLVRVFGEGISIIPELTNKFFEIRQSPSIWYLSSRVRLVSISRMTARLKAHSTATR